MPGMGRNPALQCPAHSEKHHHLPGMTMMTTFEKQAKRGLRDRLFLMMVVVTSVLMGVGAWGAPVLEPRQAMREFVIKISKTAKTARPGFLVIPQNGVELVTTRPDNPQAPFVAPYLAAIDAVAQEDLFYGAVRDDCPSPPRETARLLAYLDRLRATGKPVLVTDYCSTPAHVADARAQNAAHRFLSFTAPSRELDRIPADLVTSDAAPPAFRPQLPPRRYNSSPAPAPSSTSSIPSVFPAAPTF